MTKPKKAFLRRCTLRSVFFILIAGVLTSALLGCASRRQHAFERRHAAYLTALNSYSQDLKPGTTREAVQQYLQQRNKSLEKQVFGGNPWDGYFFMGYEGSDEYCAPAPVYLVFHFSPAKPNTDSHPAASDSLENITLSYGAHVCA
jgi:hypothetical protein